MTFYPFNVLGQNQDGKMMERWTMSKTPTNHGKLCPTLHRWVVIDYEIDDEIDDENDEIIDDEIDDQYCFWISRILPRILSSVLHSQLENCAILELKQLWCEIPR